jgi:transcriptional regulator with XRE-family HTH domain
MSHFLPSIDQKIPEKLQNRSYRARFFVAETSANIAAQLIALRKRRGLSQKELADLAETGQPAISRVERADYSNWSFNTLRKLAEVMDARIRVLIEPAEDVLGEYSAEEEGTKAEQSSASQLSVPAEHMRDGARRELTRVGAVIVGGSRLGDLLTGIERDSVVLALADRRRQLLDPRSAQQTEATGYYMGAGL